MPYSHATASCQWICAMHNSHSHHLILSRFAFYGQASKFKVLNWVLCLVPQPLLRCMHEDHHHCWSKWEYYHNCRGSCVSWSRPFGIHPLFSHTLQCLASWIYMGTGSKNHLELRLASLTLNSFYLFLENTPCGPVWTAPWKSNSSVTMHCMRATHHNAAVRAIAKQSICPEEWSLHPEAVSQICERSGKAFTNATSTYYSLWFFLHGQPHRLNEYAVHNSTMDGISLGRINLLQSFWKDQGDFVQEGSRGKWLHRVHNVMYSPHKKTSRNAAGKTGSQHHSSSNTGLGLELGLNLGLWKPESI